MEITWLGTAAFKIVIEDTVIFLDPYLSRNERARPVVPLKPQDIAAADYIFLSHGHFDHACDVPLIASRTGARVLASSRVCDTLRTAGLPDEQLRPLQGVETLGFTHFRVRTIPAAHIKPDWPFIWKAVWRMGWRGLRALPLHLSHPAGDVMAYLFTVGEHSFAFFGSAGYERAHIEGLRPDLALVPTEGHTDIHRIVAEMVALLAPRWVIPHHHDDFYPPISRTVDLAPFVAQVRQLAPQTQVHIPEAGRAVRFERGTLET